MLLTCRMWGSERRDSKANRREDDGGDEGQRHRTSTVCAQQTGNDWGRPGGLARQHDLLTLRERGHGSSIASTSILWKITSTWKFMMLKFDASSFHTDLPPPSCCKRGNMFCFGGVKVGTVHLEHLWVYVKTFLEHTLFQREFSVPCESFDSGVFCFRGLVTDG